MNWPKRLGPARAFRLMKRRQFLALLKTARDLRYGCAFMPSEGIGKLVDEIERIYRQLQPWWKND